MPTSTANPRTHCGTCGAKLPDRPLSICPYCASPLDMPKGGAKSSGEKSPNAERIAKVVASDEFAAAQAFEPPEPPTYWAGKRISYRGGLVAAAGVGLLVWRWMATGEALSLLPGAIVLLIGSVVFVKGRQHTARATASPLLKRAGVLTDRRSTTDLKGYSGSTTYHFTVEFEEGVVGEFEYPGRGAHEDPYTTNLSGVAYTRGTTLLAFKQIRV